MSRFRFAQCVPLALLTSAFLAAALTVFSAHDKSPKSDPAVAAEREFTDELQELHVAHAARLQDLYGDDAGVAAAQQEHRAAVGRFYRSRGKTPPPGID